MSLSEALDRLLAKPAPVAPETAPDPTVDELAAPAFDPGRPATAKPPDLADMVREQTILLRRIADRLDPDIPGIEGAEVVPELDVDRFTVGTGAVYPVMGNRRYSSRLIRNLGAGTLRLTYKTVDPNNVDRYWTINVDDAIEINAKQNVYLIALTASCTVEVLSEAV